MKITEVTSVVRSGAHFVKISTDEGLSGVGQSADWAYPTASDAIVRSFTPYLLGADPRRIEHHWSHLYRMGPFRGSSLSAAVSAVDIALWDILGKSLGVPIWQLLGGAARISVRLMQILRGDSLDALLDEAAAAAAEGITAVKISPFPADFFDLSTSALIDEVVARVYGVREVVGRDIDVALEFGRRLTPALAVQVINELVDAHPMFVEDPIQIDSIDLQSRIAPRVAVPMAEGERLHTIWEFRELLMTGGPQYVRPDLGLAGGFSHCRKIAALAESFHCAVVPHNYLGPVLTAAAVHLDVAIPNFLAQEFLPQSDEGINARGIDSSLVRRDGFIEAPTAPGLGVEIDFDAIVEHPGPNPLPLHRPALRQDGSVWRAV